MDLLKLKDQIKDITIDGLIDKYAITFTNNKTMIINKKIPVNEFIYLRKNIQKFREVNNVIVDTTYTKNDDLVGIL